jgi:hypothetical protein
VKCIEDNLAVLATVVSTQEISETVKTAVHLDCLAQLRKGQSGLSGKVMTVKTEPMSEDPSNERMF